MLSFFSRRRKLHSPPVGNSAVLPRFTATPNSPYNNSFVEQKIHPDLNSLADELASSQGHKLPDMTAENENTCVEVTGFIGLEPSTKRSRRQNGTHTRTQEPQPVTMGQQFGIPDTNNPENFPHAKNGGNNTRLPGITSPSSDSPTSITASSPKKSWSIFGRNNTARVPHRKSNASSATSNASRSRSQSTSSQRRTRSTSQSIETSQPRTPKSQRSNSTHHTRSTPKSQRSNSTHHTRSTSCYNLLPSPHTFGIPTPPQQPITRSGHDNSYFGFREIPPPLPPLDHPAFRQASKNHTSSTSNFFPTQKMHGDIQEKFPRHSHSLPSLGHSGSIGRQRDIKSSGKRHRRASSKSNSLRRERLSSTGKTNTKQYHRNDSVASSIGVRRSSAESSARKASSVDNKGGKRDECWEAQVSKEMVRLALHKFDAASSFGIARGENVGVLFHIYHPFIFLIFSFFSSWRPDWGLVRHFFCKVGFESEGPPHIEHLADLNDIDTLTRNLRDTKPLKEYTVISSPKSIYKSSNVAAKHLRTHNMSHGDPSMVSGNSGRKGKERESEVTLHNSRSRQGGRTNSTPSLSMVPSSLPNLDATPFASSIPGSSSLVLPVLSVISPTPNVSPVSPSRRPHHRSQPTMPTTSVLQRSGTPIIEQSQSIGSGKRKADEAGVGGDKTPPKDSKEQRATFAPDPRGIYSFHLSIELSQLAVLAHRTSATSGLSSHAPSSYNRSKRVRLTQSFDARYGSRSNSRTGSLATPDHSPPNAKTTGSLSSRGSRDPKSTISHDHVVSSTSRHSHSHSHGHSQAQNNRPASRRSLSQASIPISALVSPHAPSIARSGAYHMRDPRKPPPIQSTTWSLAFPSQVREGEARWAWKGWVERGGSPLHAWLFFIGFILFPLWWAAAFIPVRRTRRLGSMDAEKGVVLDDPQLEHGESFLPNEKLN